MLIVSIIFLRESITYITFVKPYRKLEDSIQVRKVQIFKNNPCWTASKNTTWSGNLQEVGCLSGGTPWERKIVPIKPAASVHSSAFLQNSFLSSFLTTSFYFKEKLFLLSPYNPIVCKLSCICVIHGPLHATVLWWDRGRTGPPSLITAKKIHPKTKNVSNKFKDYEAHFHKLSVQLSTL